MAAFKAHEKEPACKRRRLSPESDLVPEAVIVLPNAHQAVKNADSSFTLPSDLPDNLPSDPTLDYILNISKYIPVGCLRIQRSDCAMSLEVWTSCNEWRAFAHPRDVYNPRSGPYLLSALQELLFNSQVLQPYRGLHNAGWIRMEFKIKDQHLGQFRVYILPDDVGRGTIDRQQMSLRRSMQLLIAQIDTANATWSGEWSEHISVAHVDSSLDEKAKQDVSLFYLFNTLPSPKPDPEIVVDRYAREAMYKILESDIEGLLTKMHMYQRRSAALMLQRETQPAQIIDPRLRPIIDQKGRTWYCDSDAGCCLREPRTFEGARGGICAETMGLGKTLICLALILATRDLSSQIPVEYSLGTVPVRKKTGSLVDMVAATIGRTGTPWMGQFAQLEAEGYDFVRCREALRRGAGHYFLPSPPPRRESRNPIIIPARKIWLTTATIVVVPSNLVQQWRHEIKKHTVGIKVLVVNSMKTALPPAQELAGYDIILFSKQRFDKEAKDGSDENGRRQTTNSSVCRCPYIGATRERDCTCFKEEEVYRSPLKDLHFKRLITDEGHTFGNSSKSSRTEAVTVVDFLQLSARWIVSGTPTQGLYGAEVPLMHSESSSISNTPLPSEAVETPSIGTRGLSNMLLELPDSDTSFEISTEQDRIFYRQERRDLEKLGNIATVYLKARPWANTHEEGDQASWSQYVMQPRHGSKSHGNMECLKSTLEGMIIRHRPDDVSLDVNLPPLHQTVVYLDGSMQDKLSLNLFSMMIVSNAVTSERKDADYLFHPRQRKALLLLVSNLRQASFFWSGYTVADVEGTIDIAKRFLEKGDVPVTPEDEILLREAVKVGDIVLSNKISRAVSKWHEMPMYVQNGCPEDARGAWSLDKDSRNPTMMGATMVRALQKFVESQLWKEDPMEGLLDAGKRAMDAAYLAQNPPETSGPTRKSKKDPKFVKKVMEQSAPALAGGVSVGDGSSPKKRSRTSSVGSVKPGPSTTAGSSNELEPLSVIDSTGNGNAQKQKHLDGQHSAVKPKSAMRKPKAADSAGILDPASPLASTSILSTSSAKLSYLIDRITVQQSSEKILVFYEADNVAYYIAQALECLGIKHLIYAKSLSSERRSQYVVTFNQSDIFRVLLMDVTQAAFGLDMSSASRVYFVNPVFSPQVEAQAVKRAHRIGQTKPVFVETLVLKGSIEEVILERRKDMSTEEHNKCKSILDDQTMYDWIRNVRFLPVPSDELPGPEQMAKLETPQLVFLRTVGSQISTVYDDPDADLILDDLSPKVKSKSKGKGKRRPNVLFADDEPASGSLDGVSENARGKRKVTVKFAEDDDLVESTSNDDGGIVEDLPRKKRKSVGFNISTTPIQKEAVATFSDGDDLHSLLDDLIEGNDAIEYSTPRPRSKKIVHGIRMPDGSYKLPRRSTHFCSTTSTSGSSTPSPTSSQGSETPFSGSSQTKAQRARLDESGAKSLLLQLKMSHEAANKLEDIEKKADRFRRSMIDKCGKIGPMGWEVLRQEKKDQVKNEDEYEDEYEYDYEYEYDENEDPENLVS